MYFYLLINVFNIYAIVPLNTLEERVLPAECLYTEKCNSNHHQDWANPYAQRYRSKGKR